MTNVEIAALRSEYTQATLSEADACADPMDQFRLWLNQAVESKALEPSAMTLATTSTDGIPSARIVLLKGADTGFVFFTNYLSQKGRDLESNPRAALLFFWPELERQVRIQGSVVQLSDEESTAYFVTRPRESQIGAWSSKQSTVVSSREYLDEVYTEYSAKFANNEVPKPPFWGGYRLCADSIEFWQGRASRMHDRIRYRQVRSTWTIERLSP